MRTSIVGGILLVVGTSVGGGMLALPMITVSLGFFNSMILFVGVWALMTLSAFLILELNLALPRGSNLISMARLTLGRAGAFITWSVYLLLLYSLLSAYLAGGGDLLQHMSSWWWSLSLGQSIAIFGIILALLVYGGVRCVDWATRGLMLVKFILLLLLLIFICPHVEISRLETGHGMITFSTDLWCLGCDDDTKNLLGKAIIVHQGEDDLTSQPSGAAGARVSCSGIIQ